jgi:hypothetical protein
MDSAPDNSQSVTSSKTPHVRFKDEENTLFVEIAESHDEEDDSIIFEEDDSIGENDLADIHQIFGLKVRNDPASTLSSDFTHDPAPSLRSKSITGEARPGLEQDALGSSWLQKSKKAENCRNMFAKTTREPFFLIISNSKRLEYVFYTVLAIVIQLVFGWSYFFPDGRPACSGARDGLAVRNPAMCDLMWVLGRAHSQYRVLVAFILGGFIAR